MCRFVWAVFRLSVPASSANLGPGFDALGLALGIYLHCRVEAADELKIAVSGRDAESIPSDAGNLIWRTASEIAAAAGRTLAPISLAIDNEIPLGKGLGSSAAALVAAAVIADRLLGLGWDRPRILDEAARREGHPDNVSASVFGSIAASAMDGSGGTRSVRLEVPDCFGVAVVVPDFVLPTSQARAVLPSSYSRQETIFNLQRSTLLTAALATGNLAAFPAALQDRLHQSYRAKLVPGLEEILALRAPGLLGCALSGAGPSVLVLFERGHAGVCSRVRDVFESCGRRAEVLLPEIARHGYRIEPA